MGLCPLDKSPTNWTTVPAPDDECGPVGGMRIGRVNLPQCHFVNQKSHMTWPGLEPGPTRWEAGD
jgi:hypothetical protein